MSFLKNIFGGSGAAPPVGAPAECSHQLPSSMVAKEFGEVNVKCDGGNWEILFTIMKEPDGQEAEGWQTGVALDASGSMQAAFGRGLEDGPAGSPPKSLLEHYHSQGWLEVESHEGQYNIVLSEAAKIDLVERGHFRWTKNEIEPFAQKMAAYLAENLDADGGTTVIYWACGDGSAIEAIGDFTSKDCETASFSGPQKAGFGSSTILSPAVRYFAERFEDASNGMYIFITDGEIHDLDDVKKYTIQLCQDIAVKRRNPLKCVLIGIGDGINAAQLEELDDLDSGTDIDLWDHKIAKDMRTLVEIFAEVVSENQIVAPTARILDSFGNVVKNFTDGLPAKVFFTMPASSSWFELEVAGQRIKQPVSIAG